MVENTVGKEEIARHEQFLLFSQCFQKLVLQIRKNSGLFGLGLREEIVGQNSKWPELHTATTQEIPEHILGTKVKTCFWSKWLISVLYFNFFSVK